MLGGREKPELALAGGLLVATFGVGFLAFVGLGPPWEATPEENRARYLVLLVMSLTVACGLVALGAALRGAGERVLSTVGLATTLLAGPLFAVWMIFAIGVVVAR